MRQSSPLSRHTLPPVQQAMVAYATPIPEDINALPEPGPRCATCEQVKLTEWINWQKCWSNPYVGENGERRILAYPIGKHPIMFLLHSREMVEDLGFWWFFVCNRCRLFLRLRGLNTERTEIEDRRVNVPLIRPALGLYDGFQSRPTLVAQDWARDLEINGRLGIDDYWSRPSSPTSSVGSDPWTGHFSGYPSNVVHPST